MKTTNPKIIKSDISTKEDIRLMVDSFYNEVNKDDLLSPIFNQVAQIDWSTHLPRMYDFWNTVLLSNGGYKGNPFAKHIPLPIDASHFDRWLQLFEENIDRLFAGDVAESTKTRARSIAHVFQSKLEFLKTD